MFELTSHLHPRVIHFPIALFVTACGLEILSFVFKKESLHQTALHLYILAALTTPLVVRTGIWEAEKLRLSHPVLDKHKLFALWAMWTALASLPVLYLAKEKYIRLFRVIFLVFCISIAGLVALTAEEGGEMVYEYGVGVKK